MKLSLPGLRKTLLRKYQVKQRNRPGCRVAKARRISLWFACAYFAIATAGATMAIMEIGIPGSAWP